MTRKCGLRAAAIAACLFLLSGFASALEVRTEAGEVEITIGGKLFINSLYADRNNQGAVDPNNPANADPGGGGRYFGTGAAGALNGTNTEFELNILAEYNEFVTVGARIKNRYNTNDWTTYFSNEGLESSQYMKLRGAWIEFITPEWARPYIGRVRVGSHDLGDFSLYTVGKIRYIDRDNASGVFLYGRPGESVSYTLGHIALPSVWAGPGFTTAGRRFQEPFSVQDSSSALAVKWGVNPNYDIEFYGNYVQDKEGSETSEDTRDLVLRYENAVGHVRIVGRPSLSVDFEVNVAYSTQNDDTNVNWTERGNGFNSIIQKDAEDWAGVGTINFSNIGTPGLAFSAEYFNIGEDYVSIMAARREADALITEGFENDDIGWDEGGWSSGGEVQLPTVNIDNNETQFDEEVARSIIGWHGGTFLTQYVFGALETSLEYTFIDYNTNDQGRDMGEIYPVNQGYGFPTNAYNEFQERQTQIAALRTAYQFDAYKGMEIGARFKWIDDVDDRNISIATDDFDHTKMVTEIYYQAYVADELALRIGATYYDNDITEGSRDLSYHKIRYFFGGDFNWQGITCGWVLEKYDGLYWDRFNRSLPDEIREADELRGRAFIEFAF